ncbi:MAG: laccase domain-containing protein, partial [Gammaproteobacteria bacterium]|nr:laccase domain-containing protein [Gammaproteobacteria bacterium]
MPDWPAAPRVRARQTLRTGGISEGPYASLNLGAHVGDAPEAVTANRRRLAEQLSLPAAPRWLEQVHGCRVLDLDAEPVGAFPPAEEPEATAASAPTRTADGAVTRRPGVVCVVMTADCLPVLLAERHGRAVGVAHAGWRGL